MMDNTAYMLFDEKRRLIVASPPNGLYFRDNYKKSLLR